MTCAHCGGDTGDGRFCEQCGVEISALAPTPAGVEVEAEAEAFCTNCGRANSGGNFCGGCGQQFNSSASRATSSMATAANSVTQAWSGLQSRALTPAQELSSAAWCHYGPLVAIATCLVLWVTVVGSALAWLEVFVFLIPLWFRSTQGKQSRFVMDNATESLNFHLTGLCVAAALIIGGGLLVVATLGVAALIVIPALIGWDIFRVVVMFKAGAAAKRRDNYRYPLTYRFVGGVGASID